MADFAPATVYAYSTWPKGTPNYWALPAMGDANGWFYRKDWFAKPELQAEFKAKYNRDLAPPKTWTELKEVAEFFQGREIDGKKVYGAAIFTERASEGITMGATSALYPSASNTRTRPAITTWKARSIPTDAVKGLECYKALYKCCTPPGYTDSYMGEGLDAFKSGQVAMMMNWFAFMPGMYKDEKVGGDRSASSSTRPRRSRPRRSAARASRSSPTPTTWKARSPTSNGSPSPTCRRSGGRSAAMPATTPC